MSDSKTAEKMMKDWKRALNKEKSLNQLHLRKKFKQLHIKPLLQSPQETWPYFSKDTQSLSNSISLFLIFPFFYLFEYVH